MKSIYTDKTVTEIEQICKTNAACGLTARAASSRVRKFGENDIYDITKTGAAAAFGRILSDPVSILLILAVIVSAIWESFSTAAFIFALWAANFLVVSLSYVKAEQVFDAARLSAIPRARLIRDNKVYLVDSRGVTVGDVLLLREGDIVCADARIVRSEGLRVIETQLTGSRAFAEKDAAAIADRGLSLPQMKNMVFAGTTVVGGNARAVVVRTGADTEIVVAAGRMKLPAAAEYGILQRIRAYCRTITLGVVVASFILILLGIIFGRDGAAGEVFLTSLCFASSAMSEMFYYIQAASLGRAVASSALAKNGAALIKKLDSTDNIATVGTLVMTPDALFEKSGIELFAYSLGTGVVSEGGIDRISSPGREMLFEYILALSAAGESVSAGTDAPLTRAVYDAVRAAYGGVRESGFAVIDRRYPNEALGHQVILTEMSDGERRAVFLGNAGELLRASKYRTDATGNETKLTNADRDALVGEMKKCVGRGGRIYAVAYRRSEYKNLFRVGTMLEDMVFVGFAAFRDRMLPGASDFAATAHEYGVTTVLLAPRGEGDKYAALFGTRPVSEPEQLIIGLLRMQVIEIPAGDYGKRTVEYLKGQGECVGAVSSDFFVALKLFGYADASFTYSDSRYRTAGITKDEIYSMTGGGIEALRRIADVVSVPRPDAALSAVRTCRGVFASAGRSAEYLLSTNIVRFLLVLASVFMGVTLLTARQILISGLVTDLAAMLLISLGGRRISSNQRGRAGVLALPTIRSWGIYASAGFCALLVGVYYLLGAFGITLVGTPLTICVLLVLSAYQCALLAGMLLWRGRKDFLGIQ